MPFACFLKESADTIQRLLPSRLEVNPYCIVTFLVCLTPFIVARMVSDALGRNRDDPEFEVYVVPCSITYMCVHRHVCLL